MSEKINVLGVVPARMGSSRFPGKPLELIHGQPMIWHVWQRCLLSEHLDDTVIATCDEEIKEAAEAFGAKVVMTSDKHERSNDRVAEVAEKVPCNIILNVQGDEPMVDPALIDIVVKEIIDSPDIQCVNPVSELKTQEEIDSPHTVKVVSNLQGRVLYFSRYPIPAALISKQTQPIYRQVPILAFRSDFCIKLAGLPAGPLELQESIDLLRAVEHDMPLHTMITEYGTVGVDTPADMAKVIEIIQDDGVYHRYA